jgi:pentatricopeptide repeat protein
LFDRLDEVELSVGRVLKQEVSFRSSDDVEKVICYDLLISGYRRANLHEKVDSVSVDMKSVGLT